MYNLVVLNDDKDEVMRQSVIYRRKRRNRDRIFEQFLLDGISPNHLPNIITRSSSNPINTVIFVP